MSAYTLPLQVSFIVFLVLSIVLLIPWLVYSYRKYGYLSIWSSIVAYSFVFYMLSALFLVLLPLPSTRDTCSMQPPDTIHQQLVPFRFVGDILKDSPVIWTQPATYIHLLKQGAFMTSAFNFLLLLPLGVYLRYFLQTRNYWKRAFFIGFCVSLFFEITQRTGIYGIYNCAYRLFDVDDLILNSTGALAGFLIAPAILALFPSKESVAAKGEKIVQEDKVLPIPQLLALFIDFLLVKVSWSVIARYVPAANDFLEFAYKSTGLLVVLFLIPTVWNGKTIGTWLLRFGLSSPGRGVRRTALFKRFMAIYLPWAAYDFLRVIAHTDLDMDSPFYNVHVWINVVSALGVFLLVGVLAIHAIVVIFRNGRRLYYFDHAADLVPIFLRNSRK